MGVAALIARHAEQLDDVLANDWPRELLPTAQERIEMLQLRTKVTTPIIYDESSAESDSKSVQSSVSQLPGQVIRFGRQTFRMHEDFTDDRSAVERISQQLSDDANMHEPLQRVGEALQETMSTVTARPRVA